MDKDGKDDDKDDILVIALITVTSERVISQKTDKIHRKGYLIKRLNNDIAQKGLSHKTSIQLSGSERVNG